MFVRSVTAYLPNIAMRSVTQAYGAMWVHTHARQRNVGASECIWMHTNAYAYKTDAHIAYCLLLLCTCIYVICTYVHMYMHIEDIHVYVITQHIHICINDSAHATPPHLNGF